MNKDVTKFKELGYVVVTDFLAPNLLKIVKEECNKLTTQGIQRTGNGKGWVMNAPHNPCKLDGAMRKSNVLKALGSNYWLKSIAQSILDTEDIDGYISKFFPMIPKEGFSVDWHQDNFYIKGDVDNFISCDVFIEGASKESGCLRVVPGSQEKMLPHTTASHRAFRWINEDAIKQEPIDIELDEPFAVLFHANLVHGCYKNTSNRFRNSVAWEYIERSYFPPTHRNFEWQDRVQL